MRYLAGLSLAAALWLVAAMPALARTDGSLRAPAAIARLVTHVPVATLNKVGAGKIAGPSAFNGTKLSGPAYTSDGKPDVLAGELAWCPHCEANSWAIAIALSRFGSLSHLRIIDSGTLYGTKYHANPSYPHTEGLSFFDARYKSSHLSFTNVVLQDLKGRSLQRLTKSESAAINSFDPMGGFPALDIGGAWGFVNSGYSPGVLAGKTWTQIARSLANPRKRIAQSIDGLANLFTAAMCDATNGSPASVCQSTGVMAAGAARLANPG